MPFEYNWEKIKQFTGAKNLNKKRDSMPPLKSYCNLPKRCTVCLENVHGHMMRYKRFYCSAGPCNAGDLACPFQLKVLVCESTEMHQVFERGARIAAPGTHPPHVFTHQMKQTVRELTTDDMKPARIRNTLIDIFNLNSSTVPPLKAIQNFVYNFGRHCLSNSNIVEEMIELARTSPCHDNLDYTTAFMFGYDVDDNQVPVLGDGSRESPLVIGVSTKRMMQNVNRDPKTFVFHMDVTFKLIASDYPVFVCGVSDSQRQFHPVAFMITSQRTESEYASSLRSLSELFVRVVQRPIAIKYFMADAEGAQYNAFKKVFRHLAGATYLMCFFHVVEKVKDCTKGTSTSATSLIYKGIYGLHYSRNQHEFEASKKRILLSWSNSR